MTIGMETITFILRKEANVGEIFGKSNIVKRPKPSSKPSTHLGHNNNNHVSQIHFSLKVKVTQKKTKVFENEDYGHLTTTHRCVIVCGAQCLETKNIRGILSLLPHPSLMHKFT